MYGIKNGSLSFQGNQHTKDKSKKVVLPNYSEPPKTQENLAKEMGISVDTLKNYKQLTEMINQLGFLVSQNYFCLPHHEIHFFYADSHETM